MIIEQELKARRKALPDWEAKVVVYCYPLATGPMYELSVNGKKLVRKGAVRQWNSLESVIAWLRRMQLTGDVELCIY